MKINESCDELSRLSNYKIRSSDLQYYVAFLESGMSYKNAAYMLGCTEQTVKKWAGKCAIEILSCNINENKLKKHLEEIGANSKKIESDLRKNGSIDHLELSVKSHNSLIKNKIYKISELQKHTFKSLLSLDGVGKKSAAEIVSSVAAYENEALSWQIDQKNEDMVYAVKEKIESELEDVYLAALYKKFGDLEPKDKKLFVLYLNMHTANGTSWSAMTVTRSHLDYFISNKDRRGMIAFGFANSLLDRNEIKEAPRISFMVENYEERQEP